MWSQRRCLIRGKQKYDRAPFLERIAGSGTGASKETQAVERNGGSQAGEALEMPNSREEVQLQCRGRREEGVELPAASAAPSPSGLATAEPGPVVACLAMAWGQQKHRGDPRRARCRRVGRQSISKGRQRFARSSSASAEH